MQKNIILLLIILILVACNHPKVEEKTDKSQLPPVAGFVAYSTYHPQVFVPFGDEYNLAVDSVAPIRNQKRAYNLFIYKNDSYTMTYDS